MRSLFVDFDFDFGIAVRSCDSRELLLSARAQHGHTTFVRTSARSAETWGLGASSPPKI